MTDGESADSNEDDIRAKKAKKAKTVRHYQCQPHLYFLTRDPFQKHIDPATLPGNKAHTSMMEQLRNKWQFNDKLCHFRPEYCYVGGEAAQHYALSHAHINVWAAAIVSLIFSHLCK